MFCFVLTSPPLMLCATLQTFEAALFLEEKEEESFPRQSLCRNDGIFKIYEPN